MTADLHRTMDRVDVLAGIIAALSVGSTSPDVVTLEARKAAEPRGTTFGGRGDGPTRTVTPGPSWHRHR
jgi:hypothetical protein